MTKMLTAILFIITNACASAPKNVQEKTNAEKYQTIAESKYQTGIEYLFNETRTHVLCRHAEKPTTMKPQHRVSFFIFDVKSDSLSFEESLPDGMVAWKNARQVEVTAYPGMVKKDDSPLPGYVYDVVTGKKIDSGSGRLPGK